MVETQAYARRHLALGWWGLLGFLTLGLVLETLHGFKVGLYLDVHNETRRLLWTLAHAHGALLALVQIVFGLYLRVTAPPADARLRVGSACLAAASFAIPVGFFAGGVTPNGGDPGLGVLLVPLAAPLLFVAVLVAALSSRR